MGPPLAPPDTPAHPPDPPHPVQLYGGALSADIPARCADVSTARPVPDHQEVFADPGRDQSVVFEIVEFNASVPDAQAAAFYFADQATQNEAVSSELATTATRALADAVPLVAAAGSEQAAGAVVLTAAGTQAAAKGRASSPDALNTVDIALAVLRLPSVASDVLVVVNTATAVGNGSSVLAGVGSVGRAGDSAALLERVLQSLRIQDWGLFG